jgi:hypothetical protein
MNSSGLYRIIETILVFRTLDFFFWNLFDVCYLEFGIYFQANSLLLTIQSAFISTGSEMNLTVVKLFPFYTLYFRINAA